MPEKTTFDVFNAQRIEAGFQAQVSDAVGEHDDATLSNELYDMYSSKSQTWRDQLVEDWDFFLGAQTSDKQDTANKKRKQKTYTVDVIFQAVEQAIALLTSNKPRFTATGTEDSDTRIAQVFAAIMQFIWYTNNATQKLKQIIKDYYVGSVGWAHVYWDPFACNGKGDVVIDTVDSKRVYVDPDAKDFFWADASHILLETYLTPEMMQVVYNIRLEDLVNFETSIESFDQSTRASEFDSGSGNRDNAPSTEMYRRIDRYSRIKVPTYIIEKPDERFEMQVDPRQFMQRTKMMPAFITRQGESSAYVCAPRNVAEVSKLYNQFGEVFHEIVDQAGQTQLIAGVEGQVEYQPGTQPVPDSTTYLEFTNVLAAVKRGAIEVRQEMVDRIQHTASIGQKVLFQNVIPTEHHVLVPLINNFDRTISPVGDVRRVKREQEFINSIRQIVVSHAAVTTNFKIGYPEGRYNEDKLNNIYSDPQRRFIPYDAEMNSSGLQVLAPPPLPNHLYTLEERARKNIEERLGIFALMQGSPTDAPSTYKGTVALDEYGQRRIKSKKDDVEEFLNHLGKIVVSFVQYYYTDNRVISVVTPNDKPLTVMLRNDSRMDNLHEGNQYRINDIAVGKYDVMVVSGSTLPSNRWALLEVYMDLFKLGLVDQETVLQKTEVANVEKVMERVGQIQQLTRMVEELQGQVKKLSGDLQTAEREVVHAKREKDLTQTQVKLKEEEIMATAANMIHKSELKNARSNSGN